MRTVQVSLIVFVGIVVCTLSFVLLFSYYQGVEQNMVKKLRTLQAQYDDLVLKAEERASMVLNKTEEVRYYYPELPKKNNNTLPSSKKYSTCFEDLSQAIPQLQIEWVDKTKVANDWRKTKWLVVSASNYGYRQQLINMIISLTRQNTVFKSEQKGYLTLSLETTMDTFLEKVGLPCHREFLSPFWGSASGSVAQSYSQAGFNNVTYEKTRLLLNVIKYVAQNHDELNLALIDADVAFIRHPWSYLLDYSEKNNKSALFHDDYEGGYGLGTTFLVPSTIKDAALRKSWWQSLIKMWEEVVEEQEKYNKARDIRDPSRSQKIMQTKMNGKRAEELRAGKLPLNEFTCGKFADKLNGGTEITPYVVHNNWVVGTEARIGRWRQEGWWWYTDEFVTAMKVWMAKK
eukprot:TRINITY_DN11458_c0_g1_i1.p1 TRINITY_DN11458_c0_g1~~TRINITY_DN11458_c0_g1_i1.p1  ORF type:complete len:402 (-),score=80.07 TRINITY_DN11458_c0_g1_i1:2-1207(-)